jgi:hypothetical protein
MDIPEMAAAPKRAAEQEEQQDEGEEYEEGIMIRRSDLLHFQETLVDIRSQIADLQRDARQGQARGPADVSSHHGQTASSSRTFCTTTSPVTSS